MKQHKTKDYMVRAIAADNAIRAFAITGKEMVETAKKLHHSSPIVTAASGRLMSAAAMMSMMLKGEKDILTLQIKSAGQMKGLTVTANTKGQVKGYPVVPDVMLPPNEKGKLDVGGALGPGELFVIKDMGLKEPYVGRTLLQTSEIAEDLTYYFAASEQIPSSVGLGVLMNKDNTVREAGGFIIQLMPFTPDEVITGLERRLEAIPPVSELLDKGYGPEEILSYVLSDFHPEITDRQSVEFFCDCSEERVERVLYNIGREELEDMIREGEPIEIKCHFCNSAYHFGTERLKEIIRS